MLGNCIAVEKIIVFADGCCSVVAPKKCSRVLQLAWQPGCLLQTRGFPSLPHDRFGFVIKRRQAMINYKLSTLTIVFLQISLQRVNGFKRVYWGGDSEYF